MPPYRKVYRKKKYYSKRKKANVPWKKVRTTSRGTTTTSWKPHGTKSKKVKVFSTGTLTTVFKKKSRKRKA
jgi:hypothetical protein